jgi:hypothetical protein
MLQSVTKGDLPTVRNDPFDPHWVTTDKLIRFKDLVHTLTIFTLAPLFDIYTLARMIRFDMKRVIIYAGSFHTKTMRTFLLKHLGFQSTKSIQSQTRKKNFQCISMKGVPQPWFT